MISSIGHLATIVLCWAWAVRRDDVGRIAAAVFTTYWGIIAFGLSGLISLQWFIDDSATKLLWVNLLPIAGMLLSLALLFGGVGLLRHNPKARPVALVALSIVFLLNLIFVGRNLLRSGFYVYMAIQLLDVIAPALVITYIKRKR